MRRVAPILVVVLLALLAVLWPAGPSGAGPSGAGKSALAQERRVCLAS